MKPDNLWGPISRLYKRVGWVIVAIALLPMLLVNAAAADLGPLNGIVPYMPWLLLFGVVFLAIGYFGRASVSARSRGILNLFGGLFLVLALLVIIVGMAAPGGNGTTPPPPTFTFTVNPSIGTTGGDTVPAGDYDSCDVESGTETTSEWTTTEGTIDPTTSSFIARVAIDTDLATTAALWQEPNCLQMVFGVRLNTPVDANGDGVNDAITYYAEIDSISRTMLSTDGTNGTMNTQVFVRDGIGETADWDVLYLTDSSVWIPACPEFRGSALMGSSCGPVAVGAHPGSAAADTVNLYMILGDRGPFGYQEPSVGNGIIVTFSVAGKSFSLSILLNSRGSTNLS